MTDANDFDRLDLIGVFGTRVRLQWMHSLSGAEFGDMLSAYVMAELGSAEWPCLASAHVGTMTEPVVVHAGTCEGGVCWLKFGSDHRGSVAINVADRERVAEWIQAKGGRVFL